MASHRNGEGGDKFDDPITVGVEMKGGEIAVFKSIRSMCIFCYELRAGDR